MKLAISGKGGVGKTLVTALLARAFAAGGYAVTAIDADPDANLGLTLGFSESPLITPVAEMKELITERTESQPGRSSPYFKINPRVDDIPSKYSLRKDGIRLLVMGKPRPGGGGCYCPENAVLAALVAHLLLSPDEVVIMDMAAGIEHLNRGTARAVDLLLIVVEPGKASIETAGRIVGLAKDLGLSNIAVIGNKVHNQAEKDFIIRVLPDYNILGFLPYDEDIARAELAGIPLVDSSQTLQAAAQSIFMQLIKATDRRA